MFEENHTEALMASSAVLCAELRERRESALSFMESPDTLFPVILETARKLCTDAREKAAQEEEQDAGM